MSHIKIILHCIWSTKEREPYLSDKQKRHELLKHIWENAKEKGIFIDHIGGERDHIHCLISLGKEQTIAKVMHLLKGESSYWYNKEFNLPLKWQDDYFAVSISESLLPTVREYIRNQEKHHKTKSFQEEEEEIRIKNSF